MKQTWMLVAGLALCPAGAGAGETLEAALAEVQALGKSWGPDEAVASYDAFGPLLRGQETGDVRVERDIAYGPHERHRLDVFHAEDAEGAPVLVYIHGGGLAAGDKQAPRLDGAAYDNVGYFAARHGLVGVTMNYRLVPDVSFPGVGEDLAAAVEWMSENIDDYGGDPGEIIVVGHSAGGTVLGEYLYAPEIRSGEAPDIAGAVFLSGATGSYGGRPDVAEAYLGPDQDLWQAHSVNGLLRQYDGARVPTMVVTSDLDPASIERAGVETISLLCEDDAGCPRFMQAQGHNHISTALALNTGDRAWAPELLDFVSEVTAQSADR